MCRQCVVLLYRMSTTFCLFQRHCWTWFNVCVFCVFLLVFVFLVSQHNICALFERLQKLFSCFGLFINIVCEICAKQTFILSVPNFMSLTCKHYKKHSALLKHNLSFVYTAGKKQWFIIMVPLAAKFFLSLLKQWNST